MLKYILLALSLTFLSACGSTYDVRGKQGVAPAANIEIEAEESSNRNTALKISGEHTAESQRVEDGSKGYVVWVRGTDNDEFSNIGAVRITDEKTFEFETKVPHEEFDLMMTAESNLSARSPSGEAIFEKRIKR